MDNLNITYLWARLAHPHRCHTHKLQSQAIGAAKTEEADV